MKITVNTIDLKAALMKKSFNPVLENVVVTMEQDSITLSITDFNNFAKTRINADIEEDFHMSIEHAPIQFAFSNTKALLKAAKFSVDYETVLEYDSASNADNVSVTISNGDKKVKQLLLSTNALPQFPVLQEGILNMFEYSNQKLRERFEKINYAVSKEKINPILQGIHFNGIDMVAIDGYRLALNSDEFLSVPIPFTVSCEALKLVNALLGEHLQVTTDGKYVQFIDMENEGTAVTSRLYEGEYINYSKVIPNKYSTEIGVDTKKGIAGLKYLKTFLVPEDKRVAWYKDRIAAQNSEGYFESSFSLTADLPFEIQFNCDYMIQALSQFEGTARIRLVEGTAGIRLEHFTHPIVVTSEQDENNLALVLPMNILKGGKILQKEEV